MRQISVTPVSEQNQDKLIDSPTKELQGDQVLLKVCIQICALQFPLSNFRVLIPDFIIT